MTLNENLKKHVKQLNSKEAKELVDIISSLLVMPNYSLDSAKNIDNNKGLDAEKCPICNENHVIKYGRRYDRQRYKCKTCGKVFDERTTSAISHTKLSLDKWFKYVDLLIKKVSIRECAKILDISVKTAFFMRHKIIDCLSLILKKESVDESISIEGIYFKSYCEDNYNDDKLGCVAIYSDISGNMVSTKLYTERDKILDAEKNIIKNNKNNINMDEKGVYFTQNIERHYSMFKGWLKRYRGVSIKYLSNYLTLFSWSEKINKENIFYKIKILLSKILSIKGSITIDMIKYRLVEML